MISMIVTLAALTAVSLLWVLVVSGPSIWRRVKEHRSRKQWTGFEETVGFTHLYRVVRVRYASGAEDVYRYISNDYRDEMWYLETIDYTKPSMRKYDDNFRVSFNSSVTQGINRQHIEELEYLQKRRIEGTVGASGRWKEGPFGNKVELDEVDVRIESVNTSPDQ